MRRTSLLYEAKYPDLTRIYGSIELSWEILGVLSLDTNGVFDELAKISWGNGLGICPWLWAGLVNLGCLAGSQKAGMI